MITAVLRFTGFLVWLFAVMIGLLANILLYGAVGIIVYAVWHFAATGKLPFL